MIRISSAKTKTFESNVPPGVVLSKNFELLRKIERERAAAVRATVPAVPVRPPDRNALLAHRVSDELRKLVGRVFLPSPAEIAPRVVLFAAVEAGQGKSWVCGRAAEMLAELFPGSICVLDAGDAPSLHRYFRVDNETVVAQPLNESAPIRDFALPLRGDHLWFIPGGRFSLRNGLQAPSLPSRVRELRAEFDYVLIEGPPVPASDDSLVLGQFSDGIILIVEANSTRRQTARRVQESLRGANVKLLGVVMTDRTYPIPDVLYQFL